MASQSSASCSYPSVSSSPNQHIIQSVVVTHPTLHTDRVRLLVTVKKHADIGYEEFTARWLQHSTLFKKNIQPAKNLLKYKQMHTDNAVKTKTLMGSQLSMLKVDGAPLFEVASDVDNRSTLQNP
ncbi:hypothetical protein BD626DRAFT_491060 [Schizophyllum amplum]|uniref:EthD domain-containing protein n=1 Tax=Schizophyllum amplum TaxID=97359 RepID=A0A550CHK6_9AGAR|nr:hypothetical protein BD626DRAFT_491060 [Auriculariopsis ampla]